MRNIYRREQWNKKDEIHESDGYCPSIEKALFKQHKLQQLLAQNQLKKLGLQTAQALIKALYEQMKRLQIQNYEYRSQLSQMYRQFVQKQKQLQKQIYYLRQKSVDKPRQRKFSQSKEYMSNILMPDISRRLTAMPSQSYNNYEVSKQSGRKISPIKKIGIETVSKQYVDMRDYIDKSKQMYEQTRDYLMSEQLDNVLVDFEQMGEVVRQQQEQLEVYKKQYIQSWNQVDQLSKQITNNKIKTLQTITKPTYTPTKNSQHPTADNSYSNIISKKLSIKGKKLFTTEYDHIENTQAQNRRVQFFQPYVDGKVNNNNNDNNNNNYYQQYDKNKEKHFNNINYRQIIKEYQNIIQQYKQYSAYLKAYLCSCIGFISKQTQQQHKSSNTKILQQLISKQSHTNTTNTNMSTKTQQQSSSHLLQFPSTKIFNYILNNIISTVTQKIQLQQEIRKSVQKENQQLKFILDQLINNIKLTGLEVGLEVMKMKEKTLNDVNRRQDFKLRKTQIKSKQKYKVNGQRSQRNKNHKISINRPIIHRMTITQANNYYQPVK